MIKWLLLTVVGGLFFVGSQGWEWYHFIHGTHYGSIHFRVFIYEFFKNSNHRVALKDFAHSIPTNRIQHENKNGVWFMSESTLSDYTLDEVIEGFEASPNLLVRTQIIEGTHKTVLSREESLRVLKENGSYVVEGANLKDNEYGSPLFADFFFFITGFHGFHVFSGVKISLYFLMLF